MKKSRPYIRLYVTAIIISFLSSCGTVVKTNSSCRSLNDTKADTVITVKHNLLKLFMQRYIPAYNQDYKSPSDAESKYGISAKDAFEHYSRIYIKERDIETLNKFQGPDNEPDKLHSCQITIADSCAYSKSGTDSFNLNDPECQTEKIYSTADDSLAEHIHTCRITFGNGNSCIDIMDANNIKEISRIYACINKMNADTTIVLDSIYISSSASPEGLCSNNYRLAEKRYEAVLSLLHLIFDCKPSASETESNITAEAKSGNSPRWTKHIQITSNIIGEDWNALNEFISTDNNISISQKIDFIEICEIENPDERERALSSRPYYKYISDVVYPELRVSDIKIFYHTEKRK